MGRRLDGFDIELEFDSDGKVRTVSYRDGDGCGHEALFSDPNTKLRDVVDYHLAHYKRGHDMVPERKCSFVIPHPDAGSNMEFYCDLEPHKGENHELRTRKVAR